MNKIEFEIGGKKRGFIVGLAFLGDMLNHFETDINGLGKMMQKNNIFAICPTSVYYAHKHYCISNKQPVDFDIYEVEDWFVGLENGMLNKNVQELLSMIVTTLTKHLGHLTGDDGDSKKK